VNQLGAFWLQVGPSCCHNLPMVAVDDTPSSRETIALGVGYIALVLIRIAMGATLAIPIILGALILG